MSFQPENPEHEESVEDKLDDIRRWLQVIAEQLGKMSGIPANDIYEDLD